MESDERREIIKIYWQQYLLLEKRMIELSDYVALDRKNYATFSNQFISMYLIICSEIDSVADEYCKRFLEQDKKNTFGITNKINLILHEYPKLQDWRCQTKFPYGEILFRLRNSRTTNPLIGGNRTIALSTIEQKKMKAAFIIIKKPI